MKKISLHLIRFGLGITFLWIGVLILKNPEGWGGYIQPWALKLLPISITQLMTMVGVVDAIIGAMILFNIFTWAAALAGSINVLGVLIVSGITDVTVRDIAILYCALAVTIETLPEFITNQFPFFK